MELRSILYVGLFTLSTARAFTRIHMAAQFSLKLVPSAVQLRTLIRDGMEEMNDFFL